ncbi:MAG: GAF domain-containing sensor histidine kinase [Gemmatimonadaceae bacterium]|nr:GAF domain-containing sensor histidine kinase [Gemmatimonadaceae bacterium]
MATDHDLATLNTLAQALSRSVDLAEVLQAALDTVAELLALDTGWVWLLDEETGAPHLAATRHLPPGLVRRPQLLMEGPCYCLTTYEAGDLRGAANVNVVRCSRLAQLVDDADGLRCHASIPLYADGRKLGILNVASRDWRELSRDELDLLYTVGALVSLAVERTRLADTRSQLAAVEERNRLAREIHDTLAQSLAAITMQLETADALAERGESASLRSVVSHALALTRATLEEARRSVLDLRSAPLDRRTLAAALRTLGDELRAAAGAPPAIEVVWEGSEDALPAAVELGLYRIAREALTNVMRHAGTTNATVRVAREPGHVRMRIEDRGAGFDPSQVAPGRFGLVGMSERARLLGGALRVESAPGRGTNIVVDVPVRGGAAARGHA